MMMKAEEKRLKPVRVLLVVLKVVGSAAAETKEGDADEKRH